MFTINNPKEADSPMLWTDVRYLIYQKEKGGQGTEHYQGYVQWETCRTMSACKSKANPRAHWEVRMGTHEQAVAYCSKKDTRIGPCVRKGKPRVVAKKKEKGGKKEVEKADMQTVKKMIDEGATANDIKDYSYRLWCSHRMAITEDILLRGGSRDWKSKVIVIWGHTGCGKSRWCREKFPNAYWKPKGKWWNGYSGEEVVIFDDFYGWLEIDTMLRITDRYPLMVEQKGAVTHMIAKLLVFTSNSSWQDWYKSWRPEHIAAMRRRIDVELHCQRFVEADGVERTTWERYEADEDGRDGWVQCAGPADADSQW